MKTLLLITLSILILSCKVKQPQQASINEGISFVKNTLDEDIYTDENKENVTDESSLRYLKTDISNTIGVVVLTPYDYNEHTQENVRNDVNICFLNDDGSVWFEFDFFGDYSNSERWEYNSRKILDKLSSENFDPRAIMYEYDMFVVDCVSEDEGYYTVLVQHFPKITKRLKKTKGLTFQTWEKHMLSAIIDPIESHSELRDAPNGNLIQDIPDYVRNGDGYYGLKVDREWLEVYDLFDEEQKFTGWIRWKDGNELLVGLYYSI